MAGTGGGTFTLQPSGAYTFNPGSASTTAAGGTRVTSVTYTASDGQGGTDTATLTVTVTGTNDATVAQSNTVTGSEDTAYVFTLADFPSPIPTARWPRSTSRRCQPMARCCSTARLFWLAASSPSRRSPLAN